MSTNFPQRVVDQLDDRSAGFCEVCGNRRVDHHHHRRVKGMGGSRRDDTNRAANGIAACHQCHNLIHANPVLSQLLGWLLPQGADPSLRSVVYRGQRARLTDDGGIEYLEEAA